jgi:N-acetylated-alpha-linked acidic dipeptidase
MLPMRFGDFADTVGQYVEQIHKLADDLRSQTDRQQKLLDAHVYQLAADPTETHLPPEREASVPFLNFAPLDNAMLRLKQATKNYDDALGTMVAADRQLSTDQQNKLNALLQGMEQALTYVSGLPGREWYQHMIYAPGKHTGYGVKTLPGVREAIEQRQWKVAEQYLDVIAEVLNNYSDRMDQATAILKN